MNVIKLQRNIAFLSLLLFLAKLWAWYITHSVTILTDALESTVNVIAGFIGLYSIIISAKPRDVDHPYGHGKAEFVSSAIEGSLICMAGLMIIYEAVSQLIEPVFIHQLNTGIWIIVLSGIVNYAAGLIAVKHGKEKKALVLQSAGEHLKADAYSTFAITIGLLIVLLTGWVWLDSIVALLFALIILRTGYRVVRKSLSGIMDESDLVLLQEVIDLLQKNRKTDWIDLHNLRVIEYNNRMHIDAHVTLPWYYEVRDAEREIHAIEDLINQHFDNKIEVFIHVDACQPYSCKLCAKADCTARQQDFKAQLPWAVDNVWQDSKHGKEL